jgi:hypothetical protein
MTDCPCGAPKPTWQSYCSQCQALRFEVEKSLEVLAIPTSARQRGLLTAGTVYAISVKNDQSALVKFGFTQNIHDRLRQLDNESPLPLDTLAYCNAKRSIERLVLKYCRAERAKGEWHRRGERTMRVIEWIRQDDAKQLEIMLRTVK